MNRDEVRISFVSNECVASTKACLHSRSRHKYPAETLCIKLLFALMHSEASILLVKLDTTC